MALFWGSSRGRGVAGAEPSPPVAVALRRVSLRCQNPEGTGGFFCPSGGLAEPPFQRWGATRRRAAALPTPDVVRWLLLPGLGPVSPMCCSVLCLVTCLALFSSASLTQLFTGTSFLPFFFFFFFNLFRFFGELARAFHIWSSNVLSSAL